MFKQIIERFKSPKKRVVVIMGGPSSEYKVSLATGKMVIQHLDTKKYEMTPIKVSHKGHWPIPIKKIAADHDLAFIAMHGEYGEDGQLQSLLEKYQLPYTGCNSEVSKITIDKFKTAKLLAAKKIRCPASVLIKKNQTKLNWRKLEGLGWPLVIKPADRGSSVGVSVVKKISDFAPAISNALAYSNNIIAEKYISGRELTCGILETNNQLKALPPTEIIPQKSDFFDYKAKYTANASKEITPPENMEEKLVKKIQRTAIKTYQAARCSGYARVDMIMDQDKNLHVLEINTLPGLTKTSLLPQAAEAAGIDFQTLLDIIIDSVKD